MGRENLIPRRSTLGFEVSGFPYQGVHELSTTQRYMLGARYAEPHTKRVFHYGKSNAACYAGRGVAFWNGIADGIDYTLLSGTQAIGDSQVTFAAATHPAFTLDELIGGSILVSDDEAGVATPTDANPQNRIIAGNDASAEDAACTVYLDQPLTRATTALTQAFAMPNPYSSLRTDIASGRVQHGMAGVPGAYVSAADRYFWIQTWGPCWVAMQSDLSSKTYEQQEAYWRWDGSVCINTNAAPGSHVCAQPAGFIIDRGSSATFLFLQITP